VLCQFRYTKATDDQHHVKVENRRWSRYFELYLTTSRFCGPILHLAQEDRLMEGISVTVLEDAVGLEPSSTSR